MQDAERADGGARAVGRLEDDARGAAGKVHGQRRLVLARGELLRARLSLDQADAEKLLRRMLTKIDDDTRRLADELREFGPASPRGAGGGRAGGAAGMDDDDFAGGLLSYE